MHAFPGRAHRNGPMRLAACPFPVLQATERKAMLTGANDVNMLTKNLDDLAAALRNKEAAALSEDVGRDLASVQALQKKHNDLTRDVAALAEKVKVANADVDKVAAANPKTSGPLVKRQAEVNELLGRVQALLDTRNKKLEDAEAASRFDIDCAEAQEWLAERLAELDAAELPRDAASAQAQLKKNDALKVLD